MERIVRPKSTEEKASVNRFAKYECKKRTGLPLGLDSTAVPLLNEILATDSSLSESVKGLMAQAKSSGTMENYGRMTAKFENFCVSKNYEYPNFDEKSVLHFVIQLDSEKATFATMCQVKPALTLVEKMTGKPKSSFSDMVEVFLSAAKRRAASEKPTVKKAGILPENVIQLLSEKYFTGRKSDDPVMLRTFVRCIVVYFTFCRFSCYSKLRAMDLEDNGTSIVINFPVMYHS